MMSSSVATGDQIAPAVPTALPDLPDLPSIVGGAVDNVVSSGVDTSGMSQNVMIMGAVALGALQFCSCHA